MHLALAAANGPLLPAAVDPLFHFYWSGRSYD